MASAFGAGPVLRTPDARFSGLPGYSFPPHYTTVCGGLRMHYIDEGPRGGDVVLLLHGEPTWCYLYRKMIPVLVAGGLRCIAPDLIGFGRSDKPAQRDAYSYAAHVAAVSELVSALALDRATLFGQDWGGLIGLRVLAAAPGRFARLVVANTGLPDGTHRVPPAFHAWLRYSQTCDELPVGGIVAGGCQAELPDAVVAAYDAPFPDEASKAGARAFPALVPLSPESPGAAENAGAWAALARWPGAVLTLFSDGDPITAGGERLFQARLPGAVGQPHAVVRGAGHFLQEDAGEAVAAAMVRWMRDSEACSPRQTADRHDDASLSPQAAASATGSGAVQVPPLAAAPSLLQHSSSSQALAHPKL